MSNISSDFPTRQPAPKIGANGNWLEWDEQTQAYVDTGKPSRGDSAGLSGDIKDALLTLAQKVAYIDENGQDYYDALYNALYPPAVLVSITANFAQGSHTVYDTDTLDSLKPYLTVTGAYDDGTSRTITDYTLSGTLTEGSSTITVTASGKTAAFTVSVTHKVAQVTGISAVFTQGSAVIYDNASLDDLKQYLVVTASYDDGTSAAVSGYTLSGTLAAGTSTITVSFGGKTTPFNVTVTHAEDTPVSGPDAWYDGVEYAFLDGVTNNAYINDATGAVLSYNTWACCDFMNCDGASTIEQYGIKSSYAAWYKSDKSYLSKMDIGAGHAAGYKKTIEVPAEAAYFRCSWALPGASSPSVLEDGAYIIPHA